MEVKSRKRTSELTNGEVKAKTRRRLFSMNIDNELIIAVPMAAHINFNIYEDSYSDEKVHCPDVDVSDEVPKTSREKKSVTTVKHDEMDVSLNNTESSSLSSGASD